MPKVFQILIGQEKIQAQVFLTPSKPKLPKSGRLSESGDGIPFPDVQNLKAWGLGTCVVFKNTLREPNAVTLYCHSLIFSTPTPSQPSSIAFSHHMQKNTSEGFSQASCCHSD